MATKKKIVITVDDATGDAEIRSPVDMNDADVLDILTMAVDATAEKIMADDQLEAEKESQLEQPVPEVSRKKTYLN